MEFLDIQISKEESFTNSSEKIILKPEKTYLVITKVQKYLGDPYCAYFGVILFNEKDEEINRRIRWIGEDSEKNNLVKLIFQTPKNFRYAQFIYRINEEVPFKSAFKASVLNPDLIEYKIVDSLLEDFDVPENYQMPLKKELTKEEEIKLEKNLVWVLGTPRSGTSWLGNQLLSYDTLSINEPLIGMHLGSIFYRNVDFLRTVDLFEKEEDYFFSNKYKKTWIHYLRKIILNRIYAQFNTIDKKIVIKEPNGSLGANIIRECLPNSKIIFLIRDGRDVLDSNINSLKETSWAVKNYNVLPWPIEKNQGITELKILAKIWVKTITILLEAYAEHDPNLRLKIKYEDLLNDTFTYLQKMYSFLEIKISEKELKSIIDKYNFKNIPEEKRGTGKIARIASPGKWKENFSEEEKIVINEIMKEYLQMLGYLD